MGVFIIANSDSCVNDTILASLKPHFKDQIFLDQTYAQVIFEQYANESLFRTRDELKITCIVMDSSLIIKPTAKDIMSGENFAVEMRRLGYNGLLAHYGTRDLDVSVRKYINVSGLRDTMTYQDLAKRITDAFLKPNVRIHQSSSGITHIFSD